MDQPFTAQPQAFPQSSSEISNGGFPDTSQTPQTQLSQDSSSDIPTMLQMNLQITMIALLKLMQNQLTAQTNSFEKTKNIPPISQAITSLHTAFHNTEALSFEKTKPDNSELEAKIKQQDAQHQYALDLMKMHHEESLAEQKLQIEKQIAEHKMQLEEVKVQMQAQQQAQQQQHQQELHEDQKEQNQIQKAQTLQQAQHTEETHQQSLEQQGEAHEKKMSEPSSKPNEK